MEIVKTILNGTMTEALELLEENRLTMRDRKRGWSLRVGYSVDV